MMDEPGPPSKKKACISLFHSTPAKGDFSGHISINLASPLQHGCRKKNELCDECGNLESSFNHSIECDNSHHYETLCTGCGKLPGDSILSQHTHSELESGDICHRCGHSQNPVKEDLTIIEEEEKFLDLYRLALDIMSVEGKPNIILELTRIIADKKFDLHGITFEIFWDTIKAIGSHTLTAIRFSQKSKTFWKFFMDKFGGAAIRALTGWKMIGSLLSGQADPGYFTGAEANLILSIPSEDVLKQHDPYNGNWPRQIPPGICEEVVNRLKAKHSQTSICLAFDGKKLAPGLKDKKGDINLLGKEGDGLTAEVMHQQHEADLHKIRGLMESVVSLVANIDKHEDITRRMRSVITLLSAKKNSLEQLIKKKKYSVEKLKQRGGDNFVHSKYGYAISMLTALLLELEDIRKRNIQCRERLGEKSALLNHRGWPQTNHLRIQSCRFIPLEHSLSEPKQGTEEWFSVREEASATGSRLYDAVGCAGLNAQKSYFNEKRAKFKKTFTHTALAAMDHGKKHEICALTTYCSKVVSCFFPECIVKESGGIHYRTNNLDLIISPDGLLYNPASSKSMAAIEIKCPFSVGLHQQVPDRYYLQIQAEMAALEVDICHFVSWTEESTRVFVVNWDYPVWSLAMSILSSTFGKDVKKCPSHLSKETKDLKTKIKTGITQNTNILCEFKSIHACAENASDRYVPPSSSLSDLKTCIIDVSEDALSIARKQYQATRQKATEVVTFVAGDLDRLWSEDQVHGVPVGYFLRGYSLPVQIVGNILEHFLTFCHNKGIHIPITCFDGQFMKLMQESREGLPLTLMEVQKQYWHMVTKKSKAQLVHEMKSININMVKFDVTADGKRLLTSHVSRFPLTAVKYLKVTHPEKTALHSQTEVLDKEIAQDIQDVPAELVIDSRSCDEILDFTQDVANEDHVDINDGHPVEVGRQEEDLEITAIDDENHNSERVGSATVEGTLKLTETDIEDLHRELSSLSNVWAKLSRAQVADNLRSCESVAKLSNKEINAVLKFLRDYKHVTVKVSGSKTTLLKELCQKLNLKGSLPPPKIRNRNPVTLKILSARCLQSKQYPKHALNVSYANWRFPSHVEKWRKESRINHGMDVKGLQDNIDWFYVPEWSTKRKQLETKKIDPHHILTRHRSALCKRDIGFAKNAEFMRVAESGTTQLKPGMMEDCLNMQSTDYSLITFSAEVEQQLILNGSNQSAELCKMVREWFHSCDEPGIDAVTRCQMKWRYRNYLLSLVDLNTFPPPGMYIRGYPKQLWEATVASIEADIFLYELTKRRSYNSRAVSSQNCEALYSSLAALPGSQNGVPTCISLESNMAKLCGESLVRLDPNRGFPLRLSSAPVYPLSTLTESEQPLLPPVDPPTYIHSIAIQNHPFDDKARKRTARHKPSGLSGLHEPARGVSGVRTHHKVDESRVDPLIRLGKRKDSID